LGVASNIILAVKLEMLTSRVVKAEQSADELEAAKKEPV